MKLLLLGPNGQLGTDICRNVDQGDWPFELVTATRDVVDVQNVPALSEWLAGGSFDALINCTGYHATDEVEVNATRAFAVNAHAVQAMASACKTKNARFFHISTDYVFGALSREEPYVEEDCPGAVNVYGASKALGESLAMLACPNATILRVASLFGVAGASGKGGNFVETMIRLGTERGEVSVVDDQTMSPTATADVAATLLEMIRQSVEPGLYHVVNSNSATWFEFASEIIRLAGVAATVHPISSAQYPTVARRPRYSVLSNAKTERSVGPLRPWREALVSYLRAKGHVG